MPGFGEAQRRRIYDSFGLVKYHYLANQKQTDGDYGLYRVDIAPNGGGPGPHFHRAMSEAFFVLSGTVKLYDGNDWIDGTPNDFLYVPPGGVHGFRNEADAPTSILMLFAPGAPREAYFEGFAQLGRAHRRRTPRVVHQERQLLRRVTRDTAPCGDAHP